MEAIDQIKYTNDMKIRRMTDEFSGNMGNVYLAAA